MSDQDTLRTLRRQSVKFNQKKSMYRDGDIIAVYTLDRPGHGSLAGCADACLLNWRLTDDETQALDTDCSANGNSHCPMTTGLIVADRKCEAFMFNRLTGVCSLLSGEGSMRLTGSSNFWSGKLICDDMSSVDDWAQGWSLTQDVLAVQGLVYWEGVLGYSWEASFQFKANGSQFYNGADALWFFAYRETIEGTPLEVSANTGYNFAAIEFGTDRYQLFARDLPTTRTDAGVKLDDGTWRTMEITFSSDGTTDTITMTVDGSQVITQSHVANPALKYLQPTYYGLGGRTDISYVQVTIICFFEASQRELGNSLGPDGSLFPTPFVMDGDDSTRDGFKTTVNTAVGFTVTYYDTYKVVDNTISGQTYVLYVCGSDKPSVETVPYAFLEALGVDDRVHDVSPFVTSACGQKRVNECEKSAPAYVDFASNSLNQTVVKNAKANVDSIIVSSGEDDNVFLSLTPRMILECLIEPSGSNIWETAKAAAEKGESKPRIAWVSHFVYGDDEHYDVSLAAYKKQYIDDANGQNVDIDEILKEYPGARVSAFSPTTVEFAWDGNDSFETKEEAQKAFVEFMSSLDGVIDETFAMDPMAYGVEEFKKEFGLTNADAKTLSWLEPGLIFRLDGELSETKGLDWFETAFTRPDLVLKDVDRVVDS
eukprot:jgi/Picre1/29082/NNA_004475.t1